MLYDVVVSRQTGAFMTQKWCAFDLEAPDENKAALRAGKSSEEAKFWVGPAIPHETEWCLIDTECTVSLSSERV